jgi:2,4-dienoyl-CoA reductase-like NADH-dependent reductase (Old Yellow Enzyme family)/thioredoxin reductase
MIVVEPVPVHPTAVLTHGNFRPDDDAVIPGFRRITEACKVHGTVMIQQLYHVGQHGDSDNSYRPNWSPSGMPSWHDGDGSHAMTDAEIREVIEGYGQAARRAYESGFDGVELYAGYHALIDQFWLPWSNRRDDAWGGTFEKRMRFSAEIIRRIRELTGQDFIIGLATSMYADVPVGHAVESLQDIVAWHDERGLMDYVTCGTGSYFDENPMIPTVLYGEKLGVPSAAALKQVVRHARVQAESHIRTPENAEQVLSAGEADLVSIVRGQIADPHLGEKARQGRAAQIRPCLSCNQMCWGRRYRDYWISCLVNPSTGREHAGHAARFEPAEAPRRLLVVGGGPGGLEVARVAAERGHRVRLAEAAPDVGGRFRLAGLQPRRGQILDLIQWYESELARLGVDVARNTPIDPDDIDTGAWDGVVLATGSQPAGTGFQRALPQHETLPGLDRGNAVSVEDVMGKAARPGQRVLVLDDIGHWHGPGTAWWLAEQGHDVTIVTRHATVAAELARTDADVQVRSRLKKLGVRQIPEAAVAEWHGDAATLVDLRDGETWQLPADTLVLATVNHPQTGLGDALAETALDVHSLGDCVAPRLATMAIHEGRELGMRL